jgi:hypothetical protein
LFDLSKAAITHRQRILLGNIEMSRTHNVHPELLLNHTWKIEISRDGNNIDATRESQFLPGDRIKIVREDGSDKVQLIIWADQEGLIYVLDGTLEEHEQVNGGDIWSRAKIKFEDTVGGGNQERTLELWAAKFRKAQYNDQLDECRSRINTIAKFMNDADIQASCGHDNLMVWFIGSPNKDKDRLAVLNKPEPGQGTGSGGSD